MSVEATFPGGAPRWPAYVWSYKSVYLSILILNLVSLHAWQPENVTPDKTSAYISGVTTFLINLYGAWSLMRRAAAALILEQILSLGRMLVMLLASTVFPAGLLVYSPAFFVVWRPVLAAAQGRLYVLWAFCAIVLATEIRYFLAVRRLRADCSS